MKKIYILLSRTNTIPARFVRSFTSGEFSHVSISLLPRTDTFYSYARRNINNPLLAGFIAEDIHANIFAKYPNTHCAVYSLDVSDEGYDKARQVIKNLTINKKKAKYSFLGALATRFGLKINRKYRFTCSQFCAYLLNQTEEITLPKHPSLMLPNDFMKLPNIELVYNGTLNDCTIS